MPHFKINLISIWPIRLIIQGKLTTQEQSITRGKYLNLIILIKEHLLASITTHCLNLKIFHLKAVLNTIINLWITKHSVNITLSLAEWNVEDKNSKNKPKLTQVFNSWRISNPCFNKFIKWWISANNTEI
jgi:hypothetical protein